MGLDMYLKAKRYVGGYDHFRDKEKALFYKLIKTIGAVNIYDKDTPGAEVSVTVKYWRKANAIHGWFVDNCQNGKDECQDSYVSREKLKELASLCRQVTETKDASLLPLRDGFFFGSRQIDDWYFDCVKETADALDKILANPALKDWDFEYHSSW